MPKKWKEFEEACCIYLNATYGNEQRLFIHHGGSDSTESDIEFKLNENSHFFIEAKMNASQCGQFVLLPDFERKTFSYSDKNKFPENEHSKEIIEHMNNNFVVFSEAGTAGVSINLDETIFNNWIIAYYSSKNARYFISQDKNSEYIIFPISEFGKYFEASAKYRMKKSGSSNPPKKSYYEIENLLSKNQCADFQLEQTGKHLYLSTEYNMDGQKLHGEDYTYLCVKESPAKFKVTKLSNTEHSNVIFSIKLKKTQIKNDLKQFLLDLEIR